MTATSHAPLSKSPRAVDRASCGLFSFLLAPSNTEYLIMTGLADLYMIVIMVLPGRCSELMCQLK